MWCRVGLIRTDVSEEPIASIFRVQKLRERRKVLVFQVVSSLEDFQYPEDGGDTLLRNICPYKTHTVSHPRRRHSS
jgi:hypothetical protein